MKMLLTAAFLSLACGAALTAPAPLLAANDKTIVITLDPRNGSAETGTMTLTQQGDKTKVVLKMTGSPGDQPAHFHVGNCDKYEPKPLYPLTTVVNGGSTTVVDAPIDKLTDGTLAVNVHKSTNDIAIIFACAVSKP